MFDTSYRNYAIMKAILKDRLAKLEYDWKPAPVEVERRGCLGFQQQVKDTAGFLDSLPYSVREFCLSKGIGRLVAFHAYRTVRIKDPVKKPLGEMVVQMVEQGTSDEELLERTYILNASVFNVTSNRRLFKTTARSGERRDLDYTGSKDGEVGAMKVIYDRLVDSIAAYLTAASRPPVPAAPARSVR